MKTWPIIVVSLWQVGVSVRQWHRVATLGLWRGIVQRRDRGGVTYTLATSQLVHRNFCATRGFIPKNVLAWLERSHTMPRQEWGHNGDKFMLLVHFVAQSSWIPQTISKQHCVIGDGHDKTLDLWCPCVCAGPNTVIQHLMSCGKHLDNHEINGWCSSTPGQMVTSCMFRSTDTEVQHSTSMTFNKKQ